MGNELVSKIRDYAGALRFPPAAEHVVAEAERALGFSLPDLLRSCYLTIGNGGFGPGYGLIGLSGDYQSAYGSLVEIDKVFRQSEEPEERERPDGLLPFCEWGCNIDSCVDCLRPGNPLFVSEERLHWPQNDSLEEFFELWMRGVDILSLEASGFEEQEIINPFTGGKSVVRRRRK